MSAERLQVGWVGGRDLWRVGFHLNALPLINNLSGMVEILETVWESDKKVLAFIVRSKDRTGKLFRMEGGLAANPISQYKVLDQGLFASAVAQEVR